MYKTHFRNIILLVVVTAVMAFLYGQIDYARPPYSRWDLANYRLMAAAAPGLAGTVPQPFAFRVLGPAMAGLLPIDDATAFYALTLLFSLTLLVLLYLFLVDRRLPPGIALVATVLLAFNRWFFGVPVWDFFQLNDVLALNFLVIMFWAMLRGRWLLFGVAIFLTAATRETAMIMVPVALLYLAEGRRLRQDGLRVLLVMTPGVLLFILLRVLIPAWGPGLFSAFGVHTAKLLSPEAWFRTLINPFMPLTFVPLVFFEQTLAFFRQRKYALVFLVLVISSTLFGSDAERLMSPAFVVYYWLISIILVPLATRPVLLGGVVLATFVASLHHTTARFPLPDRTATLAASFGALVVVTASMAYFRLFPRKTPT